MITDKTLDEALVEVMRTKRALEALRDARKSPGQPFIETYGPNKGKPFRKSNGDPVLVYPSLGPMHAAAKRATLDLTRKLAQLRAGK